MKRAISITILILMMILEDVCIFDIESDQNMKCYHKLPAGKIVAQPLFLMEFQKRTDFTRPFVDYSVVSNEAIKSLITSNAFFECI